jgi:hypothetical protein
MTALLTRALQLLNKLVPAGMAIKGLSKIDPKLSNFVTNALGAGYTADNVVEYLRERFAAPGQTMEKNRLEEQAQKGSLTPEEKISHNKRKQEGMIPTAIGTAVGLATGLGGLGGKKKLAKAPMAEAKKAVKPPPIPSPETPKKKALKKYQEHVQKRGTKKKLVDELEDQVTSQYGQPQSQVQIQGQDANAQLMAMMTQLAQALKQG